MNKFIMTLKEEKEVKKRIPIIGISYKKKITINYVCEKKIESNRQFRVGESIKIKPFLFPSIINYITYESLGEDCIILLEDKGIEIGKKDYLFQELKKDGWKIQEIQKV